MATTKKKTKRYPTGLTDEAWDRIAPLLPKPGKRGRKPEADRRAAMNANFSVATIGCQWAQ